MASEATDREDPHFCPPALQAACQEHLRQFAVTYRGDISQAGAAAYEQLPASLYFPAPNPFLKDGLLGDSIKTEAALLSKVRIAAWVPHVQFGKGLAAADGGSGLRIACPEINCSGHLAPSGPHKHCRLIAGIGETLVLGTYQYTCSHCRRSILGWDGDLLAAMPPAVAAEFPAVLTRRCGVTKQLFNMLLLQPVEGNGLAAFARQIEQLQKQQYWEAHLQYLSACSLIKKRREAAAAEAAAQEEEQRRDAEVRAQLEANKVSLTQQKQLKQRPISGWLRPAATQQAAAADGPSTAAAALPARPAEPAAASTPPAAAAAAAAAAGGAGPSQAVAEAAGGAANSGSAKAAIEFENFPSYDSWPFRAPSAAYFSTLLLEGTAAMRRDILVRQLLRIKGKVWCMDENYKVPKKIALVGGERAYRQMMTIMDEMGHIVAQWFTQTGGVAELGAELRRLQDDLKRLGIELPSYLYVDNSANTGHMLMDIFDSVEKVLEDMAHVIRRYTDSCTRGHPLLGDFQAALSSAFFERELEDVKALMTYLGNKNLSDADREREAARLKRLVRRKVPRKEELKARVEHAFAAFSRADHPVSNVPLFTDETYSTHARVLDLIDKDAISDPEDLNMYIEVEERADGLTPCTRPPQTHVALRWRPTPRARPTC